jgi:hypothetical protein
MPLSEWELIDYSETEKTWKYRNLKGDILNFYYRGDERYIVEKRAFNPSAAIMCLISLLEGVSAKPPRPVEGWRRTVLWDGRYEFSPEDYIRTWAL